MGRWIWRCVKWGSLVAFVAAACAAVVGWVLLRSSLPRTGGSETVPGLTAIVEVSRDDRGVPRIRASADDFADVAAALGFVHAQDRFFQMDMLRRRAAGELAAILGSAALGFDRDARRYRFRSVAERVLPRLPERHRRWLEAYARGVNAGLADLDARPPEYLALALAPEPWRPEDSILAALAMQESLTFAGRFEKQYDAMLRLLPPGAADFLMPETGRFDTPIVGEPGDPLGARPIPPPTRVSHRTEMSNDETDAPLVPLGSNNFAVAARKTADGRAILANDMHLLLTVPNTWYHAQLEWGGRRVVGLTLPGVPAIVAGSNGKVAWGHTNVAGDTQDYIRIETDQADPERYRVGPGSEDFERFTHEIESIDVRGRPPGESLDLRLTRWGAVIDRDSESRPLVLKWPALDPATFNINLFDMMEAASIEEAVAVARAWWGPPQNVAIASFDGRIAWVISGWIPRREGFDGRSHADWSKPGVGWTGPIDESARPVLGDPPEGLLFTANARAVPIEQARVVDWAWSAGDRAGRIAELLRARTMLTEADMLAIQLDTRAAPLDPYRDLVLEVIPPDESDPLLAAVRRMVVSWNGRADTDQPGFRALNALHSRLAFDLLGAILRPLQETDPSFGYFFFQDEEPLRRILEERPAHLLRAGHDDWNSYLRAAIRTAIESTRTPVDSPAFTWGERNRARIQHPFSRIMPMLGRWLDMPRTPLPGHNTTVRVQGPSFGASERLIVSPGHEADAILHMPGGQSGHFLSPNYRDGHAAWERGEPRPLLAGPAVSQFSLVPAP